MNEVEVARFHQVRSLTFMAVLSEKIKWYDKQLFFVQAIVDVLKEEKYTRRIDLEKQLHRDLTKMEKTKHLAKFWERDSIEFVLDYFMPTE